MVLLQTIMVPVVQWVVPLQTIMVSVVQWVAPLLDDGSSGTMGGAAAGD